MSQTNDARAILEMLADFRESIADIAPAGVSGESERDSELIPADAEQEAGVGEAIHGAPNLDSANVVPSASLGDGDGEHSGGNIRELLGRLVKGKKQARGLDEESRPAGLSEFSDAAGIHDRYQRANFEAGDLAAASEGGVANLSGSGSGRDVMGDLPEVSAKLENAAARMEKAFAGGKTVVLLKD